MRRGIAFASTLGALTIVLLGAAPMMGQSSSSYVVSSTWAQLPAGVEWGKVIAVASDSKDNIWVLRRSEPSVLVLTADGKFLKTWGQGLFAQGAHSIYVDHEGFVWTTDNTDNTVYKFNQDGKLLMQLGRRGRAGDNRSQDLFDGPSSVAVAPNGDFFVTDGYRNSRIVKFSKEGRFLKIIGGVKSSAPGQFDLPHAVVIDAKGRLIVSDRNNKRVQILDQEGTFIEEWPTLDLVRPAGLIAMADGTVYVSDTNPEGSTIKIVRDGKMTGLIGGLDGLPHFIAMDRSGAIYMADARVGGETVKKIVKK
jgi:DNA-binding beta-propeller fold protein YncE